MMAKRNKHSEMQVLLSIHLREIGFDRIEFEFKFCETREWLADLYLPDAGVLIEVDGGVGEGGFKDKNGVFHAHGYGHKRGAALADDYLKMNVAQCLGYRMLRFTNKQVETGVAKDFLKEWSWKEREVST